MADEARAGGRTRDEHPSRPLDIHYRYLDRERGEFPDTISLAEALRRSLAAEVQGTPLRDDVNERVQDPVPGKAGDIRCWNNVIADDGFVFGTLCLYRPSELQAVIEARNESRQLRAFPVDQIGEVSGRDFLKAIAYWMSVEDHFYLIQTPSIQTGAVENYFQWLLQKAGVLSTDHYVRMGVALDADAAGGDLDDLVSINVGGSIEPNQGSVAAPEPVGVDVVEGVVERKRVSKKPIIVEGWDLLSKLVPDERSLEEIEDSFRELRLQDPNARLDAEFEFFVRARSASDDRRQAKQNTLQSISNALRDMPDGAVTARGKDGIVKNGELRLKAPRKIRLAPPPDGAPANAQSSLLDLRHAFEEMRLVHRRFLEDGKIG